MRGGLCLALVLAAGAAQDPPLDPERAAEAGFEHPGPRVRVAGQRAIHAVSRIVYSAAPDDPHRLATTLSFPARVRSELSRPDGRPSERSVAYRFGSALWTLPHGSSESRAVADEDREFLLLELALRRALLLWPHGHEWSPDERAAKKAGEDGARTAALRLPGGGLATLVATGFAPSPEESPGAPPARMAIFDGAGVERLGYEAVTWAFESNRWRPASLRFVIGDQTIWTEEFLRVDRRARFADAWFQPPDRRVTRGEAVPSRIRPLDLRPGLVRRSALSGEPDWPAALARAERLLEETVAPPGHRLSRDLRVELDATGAPRAVSAWMEPWSETPPPGWESFPGGPGLVRWLPDPSAARAGVISELIQHAGLVRGEAPRLVLEVAGREDGTKRTRLWILLPDER